MSERHLRKRQLKRHVLPSLVPILPRPTDDIGPQRATKRLPQLRPRLKALSWRPISTLQNRLQLEHDNIQNEQEPEDTTTKVKPQHPAASQSYCPLEPSCSTMFAPLPINSMTSSSERKQCVAPTECTEYICSNKIPLTSADDSSPGLTWENIFSETTHESYDFSTYLSDESLQFQELLQSRRGQELYWPWVSAISAPEYAVWTAMAEPAIGVHQG